VLAPDGVTTRAASSYNQQVGFTGRYLDKETNLWYFRARYYSGSLGRFIGRDPWARQPVINQEKPGKLLIINGSRLETYAFKNLSKEERKRSVSNKPFIQAEEVKFIGMPQSGDGYQDGMLLYGAYFIPNRLDPSGMDSPACDVGSLKTVLETECGLRCCAKHDKCYHDNNCTAASWLDNFNPFYHFCPCAKCNKDVVLCIKNCAATDGESMNKDDPRYYDAKTDTFFNDPNDPRVPFESRPTPYDYSRMYPNSNMGMMGIGIR
jgi:RHS repeat-associated protein